MGANSFAVFARAAAEIQNASVCTKAFQMRIDAVAGRIVNEVPLSVGKLPVPEELLGRRRAIAQEKATRKS